MDTIECVVCKQVRRRSEKRLPRAWKHVADSYYCGTCWSKRYLLRAVTIPVASPLDCSWEDLRKDLRIMWASTTAACNWLMTELYSRDVRRNDEAKMPPMARVYLYPEARKRFAALPP